MHGRAIVLAGLMALANAPGVVSPGSFQPAAWAVTARRVSLNTGTSQQLALVPGVGELMAQRIIAARPIRRLEDLRALKGMTPKRLAKIKTGVTL
ncbi:MAG TPA: helix-hairpin-helix domain-containing protein [Stenomitos sp.]